MQLEVPEVVDGPTAARLWLQHRIDRETTRAAHDFLQQVTEDLSIAVGDAATVRVLSADGRWLFGLAAHHPNGEIQRAMLEAMRRTAEPVRSGLWRPIIEHGRTLEWNTMGQQVPVEASPEQVAFLQKYPVTRIMAAPVLEGDRPIGGVSLVRYTVDRDFSEADRASLRDVAARAARAIDFGGLAHLPGV